MKIVIEEEDELFDLMNDACADRLEAANEDLREVIYKITDTPARLLHLKKGLWLEAEDNEDEDELEGRVLTEDDRRALIERLTRSYKQGVRAANERRRSEEEDRQILEEENEMRHHYEV